MSATVILLCTFLVAIVPIIELKGAIPMGVLWAHSAGLTLSPWAYFVAAFLGTCIPAVLILLFLKPVLAWMGRTRVFKKLSDRINHHFEKKAAKVAAKNAAKAEKERLTAAARGETFSEEQFQLKLKKQARLKEWLMYLSIFAFVAIPLPLTGVWTGSAIAVFLNAKFIKSLPCVLIGNLVAGLIMMLVTLGGSAIFGITF